MSDDPLCQREGCGHALSEHRPQWVSEAPGACSHWDGCRRFLSRRRPGRENS